MRVFVSSTSVDLGPYREAVANQLERLGVHAEVQSIFGVDYRELVEILRERLRTCDATICLVGREYGSAPAQQASDEPRSYPQIEYDLAKKMGKPTFTFFPAPTCKLYGKGTDTEEQSMLQEKHWKTLRAQGQIWYEFKDEQELRLWIAEAVNTIRPVIELPTPDAEERRHLLVLLDKVKQFWIEGVLRESLDNEDPLSLVIETRPEAIDHPWGMQIELDQDHRILPKEKRIGEIFDEVNRALLILGEPGSGKTTTLLELAGDLIARAELDPHEPIPVVFNLSSWTDKPRSLVDWLAAELRSKYQIPEKIGRRWLQEQRILPLLDGLDEVKPDNRASCADAIKEFSQAAGLTGLVVCSRRAEYEGLPSGLNLNGAIRLLPLTPEQIDEYLKAAGPKLSALRDALQKDDGLQTLAQSPLMLSIMSIVYKDMPIKELTSETLDTATCRQLLFERYIDLMFERKGRKGLNHKREQTIKKQTIDRLSWLARKMIQHSQRQFLIEELQPSWLSTNRQLWCYTLCCRLISGLFFGLSVGLIRLGFAGPSYRTLIYLIGSGAFGALVVPVFVMVKSFMDEISSPGMRFRVMVQSFMKESGILVFIEPIRIRPSEQLRWKGMDITRAAIVGLMIGIVLGAFIGISEVLALIQAKLSLQQVAYHYMSDIIVYGILFTVLGGLLVGVSSGISAEKSTPNQGISLSLKNACVMGMASAVIIGVAAFMDLAKPGISIPPYVVGDNELLARLGRYGYGLYGGVIYGIFYGQMIAMIYGGYSVIMHYVLRFFLYCVGQAPFKYAKFLDYAADRIFLHKVGGGYEFIHGLLLAHFRAQSL